ncbi:peptidoglycan DD-metalloendopeptidase family protein [Salinicoccus sp. HZC-1]|uniref:peptidoglycan DD-metalloendopeptidase family protein n=1 Tax=Salinicoccus sp. HZC-1 TaxID=3385497 RepID=UPI00398B77C2
MNPIEFLEAKGFRVTSDPNEYREWYPDGPRKDWGDRDYWEYGPGGEKIYHDSYCGGKHEAYDLSDEEGAELPAVVDGVIVAGTGEGENFGDTIVLADHKGDYQYIYGHCKNLQVQIGYEVKQGDILGYQSNTNYYNNPMSSHLHFQTQPQGYIADEKTFVCSGIDPLSIDVNNYTEEGNDTVGYAFENLPQLVDMRGKLAESTRWAAPHYQTPIAQLERGVHHSATLSTLAGSTTEAFARYHVNTHDWPCIGYKFSIEPHNIINTPDGPRAVIHYNHSLPIVGYHVGNSNDLSMGILIAGDYTQEELTDAAMASFADLNNALDQDNIAMGGMFPHSAYPGYEWKKCSVYSPKYALATGEKLIGESSQIEVGEGKDEALPETYVVQQGDTLYSIAATENFTAEDLASWNGIADPTTLKIGQVLELRDAKGAAKEKATPYTIGDWETNDYGTQYIKAKGTFTVGSERIMSRSVGPYILADNEGGWCYPGYSVDYDYLLRSEDGQGRGFVWIEYEQNGETWWLPYNTWDSVTGAVGADEWGTFS